MMRYLRMLKMRLISIELPSKLNVILSAKAVMLTQPMTVDGYIASGNEFHQPLKLL
jgi:hypothetical protein